jgi:acyl-CoA reductase-like NAD-dependent aldehyde dehydrogenase
MPFGGVKESGIGREFGEFGMREYVEEHAIRLLK